MLSILQALFPSLIWNIPTKNKILYLTFDDGPVPEVTPWVLETLKKYNAKATFFCIGDNIQKYPQTYHQIIEEGHSAGNHTYNHLNGWVTKSKTYLDNVEQCSEVLKLETPSSKPPTHNSQLITHNLLFRPPYGKITPSQVTNLRKKYSIILWDVLSMDWKKHLSGDQCFERIKRRSKPGSIVLFHDSIKAEKRMKPALLSTLDYFSNQGYSFESL